MEHLPIEICDVIFPLVTIDGGSMGRALSLVSKRINEITKSMKYQSMAIHSSDQAVAFIKILECTPPHLRQVRNLYLSNTRVTDVVHPRSSDNEGSSEGQVVGRELDDAELSGEKGDFFQASKTIMTITSSTLENLAVISMDPEDYYTSDRAIMFRVDMPHLNELTLSNIKILWISASKYQPQNIPFFPCLRNLHISAYNRYEASGHEEPPFLINRIAPSLAYLRLSQVESQVRLSDILNDEHATSLRQVYIQMLPCLDPGPAGLMRRAWDLKRDSVQQVSSVDNRVVLVNERGPFQKDELERVWSNRNAGGEWVWSEPKSEYGKLIRYPTIPKS